jgi:hypothetical protein
VYVVLRWYFKLHIYLLNSMLQFEQSLKYTKTYSPSPSKSDGNLGIHFTHHKWSSRSSHCTIFLLSSHLCTIYVSEMLLLTGLPSYSSVFLSWLASSYTFLMQWLPPYFLCPWRHPPPGHLFCSVTVLFPRCYHIKLLVECCETATPNITNEKK